MRKPQSPSYQLLEQSVAGSSQKMLICNIAGRGDTTILVTASLDEPHSEAKRNIAWASLAMLPLLAESLNAVSTDSSIQFLALPVDKHWQAGTRLTLRRQSGESSSAMES
jgi:hypothetical protein